MLSLLWNHYERRKSNRTIRPTYAGRTEGKIAARAKDNGRSMNAEIIQILQDTVDGRINPLADDDEIEKVYVEVISLDPSEMSLEEFDANNEKLDWLIDAFMQRIAEDTQRFQSAIRFKSQTKELIARQIHQQVLQKADYPSPNKMSENNKKMSS